MKHFIEIKDISAKDIRSIIENSKKRKKNRSNYRKETFFKNKLMIILMEKPSFVPECHYWARHTPEAAGQLL